MSASKKMSAWAAWAAVAGMVVACSADPDSYEVSFSSINNIPRDQVNQVDPGADTDPGREGIQVMVKLSTRGVPAGTEVWITCAAGERVTREVTGPEIEFPCVTLQPGMNDLEVGCEGCRGDQLTIRVTESMTPGLAFVPIPNAVGCQDSDENPDREGIQREVWLETTHLADGAHITVTVSGSAQAYRTISSGGQARAIVDLPARSGAVTLRAKAQTGEGQVDAETEVMIHCPSCVLARVGPKAASELTFNNALILGQPVDNNAEEGLQADLVFAVGGAPGTRAELWLNGEQLEVTEQDEAGLALFESVSLEDGDLIEARCVLSSARATQSPAYRARVDIQAPLAVTDLSCEWIGEWVACRWTAPQDPGNPYGAHAWDLRFRSDGVLNDDSWSEAEEVGTLPDAAPPGTLIQTMFQVPGYDGTQLSLALRARDRAGNESDLSNTATIPAR